MNSKIKKALCVAVAGASLVGALSGCSNSKEVSNVVTYWAGIPMGDGSSDAYLERGSSGRGRRRAKGHGS